MSTRQRISASAWIVAMGMILQPSARAVVAVPPGTSFREFQATYPLNPVRDYTFLGTEKSVHQAWNEAWRYDKPAVQPSGVIDGWFDPRNEVAWIGVATSKNTFDFGLLDGYLPVVHYTYRNPADAGSTCDMTAFAVDSKTPGAIVIHIALVLKTNDQEEARYLKLDGGILGSEPRQEGDTNTPPLPTPTLSSQQEFDTALEGVRTHWETFFAKGAQIPIPDPDVLLASKASIVRALITMSDLRTHYGVQAYGPLRRMGIEFGDGFPPTVIALVDCLLDWGHPDLARDYFTAYFDMFVRDDGRVKYYYEERTDGCSVAEYGQLLWLARKCMDADGNRAWFDHIRPKLECIRASAWAAAEKHPSGLIPGCGEADLRTHVGIYFHNNGWMLRGLRDIAPLLGHEGEQARCDAFEKTIKAAIASVEDRSVTPMFIPPMLGKTSFNVMTPFETMTMNTFTSYTNYRYWPELMSSGILTREQAEAIIAYRRAHGGEVAGMTHFRDCADNWPLAEYAAGVLALGDREEVRRILFSHLAGHMTPETWTAYESVTIEGSPYRARMGNYCVPSQLVAPRLAAWLWKTN